MAERYKFEVLVRGREQGIGLRELLVVPQSGQLISAESDGTASVYRVEAVLLSTDKLSNSVGDLIVSYVGSEPEVVSKLVNGSKASDVWERLA